MVASQNPDFIALRNYITAADGASQPSSLIKLDLTHSNLEQQHLEIRFDVGSTIGDLRRRLFQSTGTPPSDQHLQVLVDEQILCQVPPHAADAAHDDVQPLLSILPHYYATARLRIHCIDCNPASISARGALENTALVEKFVLDDDAYARRTNTLRAWAAQQKQLDPKFNLQRHGQEHQALQAAKLAWKRGLPLPDGFVVENNQVVRVATDEPDPQIVYNLASIAHATVGARCQVTPGQRRGTVQWTGQLRNKPGYWIGVALDEPMGQNDGTLEGERYFDCPAKYGSFVRGPNLQVGDFPERDIFDEDSSDDEL